jgi:RNA polymerase sigma factor (sigma-70 family)
VSLPPPFDDPECSGKLIVLVPRAQAGCQEAAEELYELCREPLLAIIRRHLYNKVRRLYDSDDFLMETFRAIFTSHFTRAVLQSPETLWRYLARIAQNKVRDVLRRLATKRRDLGCELSAEGRYLEEYLYSRELSPHDQVWLREAVADKLKETLHSMDERQRDICLLILQQQNGAEIAHRLQCSRHEVHDALERLEKQLLS